MKPFAYVGAAALLGIVFSTGYLVGRAGEDKTEKKQPDWKPKKVKAKAKRPKADPGLLCLRPGSDAEGEPSANLRPALRWCESRLARCEERREFRRNEWPEEDSVESSEQWTQTVNDSLAQCGIDLDFELVDCTEYPCAAAFRPPADADPSSDMFSGPYQAYRDQLEEKLAKCEPLAKAFGGSTEDGLTEAGVFAYDAPCGGEKEDMLVLSVLHAKGPAQTQLNGPGNHNAVQRWMFRRAEDVAAGWSCKEE